MVSNQVRPCKSCEATVPKAEAVTVGKHYISLFGEESVEEGLVERKHKNVVEEDIEVVSTKISRLCNMHDGILHNGMHGENKKAPTESVRSFIFHSLLQQANEHFSLKRNQCLLWCVSLKFLFLEHFQ